MPDNDQAVAVGTECTVSPTKQHEGPGPCCIHCGKSFQDKPNVCAGSETHRAMRRRKPPPKHCTYCGTGL